MAQLKSTEPAIIQKLIESQSGPGYVLDFSDSTFGRFIKDVSGINIYSSKYEVYGTSKGKRLRAFWELESDLIFGKVLTELLDHFETSKELSGSAINTFERAHLKRCREIAARLSGKQERNKADIPSDESFLNQNFGKIDLTKLKLEDGLINVLNQRIDEISKSIKVKASLSTIFLCGSSLEGILLGLASRNPQTFNQAAAAPKDKSSGKTLLFQKWSLNDLINVGHELGYIGLDVKKFSHALRDFRNYIHPYEQWMSGFNPDEHTALISWQVLQASIAQISKKIK